MNKVLSLAVVALTIWGVARAEEAKPQPPPPPPDAPATEKPEETPAVTQGEVSVGVGSVSGLDESSKYQEYREIPNGFFVPTFDFTYSKRAWTFDVHAIDLLQEDERVIAILSKPGTLRFTLGYDQTPKWFSNTSATLFANDDGGRFLFPQPISQQLESVLPGSSVPAILESALNSAQPFPDLRYRRDKTFGGLRWTTPVRGLTLRVEFDEERRSGTHPQTVATNFSVGPDITEFAGTTDNTTQNVRVGADYVQPKFWVGGNITWSAFHNNVSSSLSGATYQDAYIVDNPLRSTDGTPGVLNPAALNNPAAAHLLLSDAPDSSTGWINVNGGFKLSSWGRVSLMYGVGRSTQDENFLPFSLNTAIVPPTPLVVLEGGSTGPPVTRFDGSIDLTRWDARFDGRPLRWLSFQVFGNGYKYDNKTPLYAIPDWVDADVELHGAAAEALPYTTDTTRLGATATFRPMGTLSVDVGVERDSWSWTNRPVEDSDEDIFKVMASWAPAAWGRFRAGYRYADRQPGTYEEESDDPPGLRTFDLAERRQDRYDLLADFTPTDRLSFGVQLHRTDDDYPDSDFGVTEDTMTGWAFDLAIDAGKGVTVSGNCGEDRFEWEMVSQFSLIPGTHNTANNWTISPDDKILSYGLGVDATLIPKRLTLDARATVTDSEGTQPATSAPGGLAAGDATTYPEVSNTLVTLDAELRWIVKESLVVAFAISHEEWDEKDFQRDPMQPYMGNYNAGANESVFLGMRVPGYDANWLRATLSYRF